jgi:hypothetical protein
MTSFIDGATAQAKTCQRPKMMLLDSIQIARGDGLINVSPENLPMTLVSGSSSLAKTTLREGL